MKVYLIIDMLRTLITSTPLATTVVSFVSPELGVSGQFERTATSVPPVLADQGLTETTNVVFEQSGLHYSFVYMVAEERFLINFMVGPHMLVLPAKAEGARNLYVDVRNWRFPPEGVTRSGAPAVVGGLPAYGGAGPSGRLVLNQAELLSLYEGHGAASQTRAFAGFSTGGWLTTEDPTQARFALARESDRVADNMVSLPTTVFLGTTAQWYAEVGAPVAPSAPPAPAPVALVPAPTTDSLVPLIVAVSEQLLEMRALLIERTQPAADPTGLAVLSQLENVKQGLVTINGNVIGAGTDILTSLPTEPTTQDKFLEFSKLVLSGVISNAITHRS